MLNLNDEAAQAAMDLDRLDYPDLDHWRPETRADCSTFPRPCPYVGCRYNLYLDVKADGLVRLNFPDLEVDEMQASCALDEVDRAPSGLPYSEIAKLLNVSRSRIEQIEDEAIAHLTDDRSDAADLLTDFLGVDPMSAFQVSLPKRDRRRHS